MNVPVAPPRRIGAKTQRQAAKPDRNQPSACVFLSARRRNCLVIGQFSGGACAVGVTLGVVPNCAVVIQSINLPNV
jgi:hypothetical protein